MTDLRIVANDPKKRSFVLPTRVVYTQGNVQNTAVLLQQQTLQSFFPDNSATATLDNRNSDTPAGILLDFGRELSGGIRMLCMGVEGAQYPLVHLRFGESVGEAMAPLGYKNAGNDHAVRDFTVPVPALSDQEWGQTGFRFVYIELAEKDTAVSFKNILAVYARRDMPLRGSFRCNDEQLNTIFDTAAYTCQLCMQGMLWDGIKRDRLVWIGDSHPEMLTLRSVFGYQPMLEESLDAMCKATPLPGWMNGMPAYSLWWLCILRDWYQYTGNRQYPDSQRHYVLGLIDQIVEKIDPQGNWQVVHFLDWPSNGTEAARHGVQALAVLAMKAAADLVALWPEEIAMADKVQAALTRLKQFTGSGENSKPAVALLYLADMLSPEYTAARLEEGGSKGFSTFMSFYLLTALARAGDMSTALKLLREYYGGMLTMGATTFWEDFDIDWMKNACPIDRIPQEGEIDIHGDFGAYCYKQFRHSLCHGWASGPVPFLMESVLGICFSAPGGKQITLKPNLGDLQWAEGSYPLPMGGELTVRCEQTAAGVQVTYTAPDSVEVIVST